MALGPFEREYLKGGYTIGVFDPSARIDYIFASHDIGVVGEIINRLPIITTDTTLLGGVGLGRKNSSSACAV